MSKTRSKKDALEDRLGAVLGRFWVVLGAVLEGLGRLLGGSWGVLGASGGRLGPSWVVRVVFGSTSAVGASTWASFRCPKGSQDEAKMRPKRDQNRC